MNTYLLRDTNSNKNCKSLCQFVSLVLKHYGLQDYAISEDGNSVRLEARESPKLNAAFRVFERNDVEVYTKRASEP